jgi:hypothetical protein
VTKYTLLLENHMLTYKNLEILGRWRILLKRVDHKVENVVSIVNACVVLHNICEEFSNPYYETWEHDEGPAGTSYLQPETVSHNSSNTRARQKRNNIANSLKQNQ